MKNDFINKDYKIIEKIKNWDDWELINTYYSELESNFIRINEDDYNRELNRNDVVINNVKWKPLIREFICNNYIDYEVFNTNLQIMIYDKLEKSCIKSRMIEFDNYNKSCLYCGLRTYELNIKFCPICNRYLTIFVVNWEEDS